MSKKLQTSFLATQKELEEYHKELEVEKSTVRTLEMSLQDLTAQLESATKDVTKTHQQLDEKDDALSQLKKEVASRSTSQKETVRALQEKTLHLETEKSKLKRVHSITTMLWYYIQMIDTDAEGMVVINFIILLPLG